MQQQQQIMKVDALEMWRLIPPEEKFQLMARAQAKGVLSCLTAIIVCCTLAIGLQLSWLMWAAFLACPFIFQFAAGKAWKHLRPMVMLEYLAARSAARRYAFATNAKDLTLVLIFRGKLERVFEGEEGAIAALEATIEDNRELECWVALFTDAVVLMSEKPGGAQVEFAHLLNESLNSEGVSPSDKGDYSDDREVYLSYMDRRSNKLQKIKLTSHFPASLVVFEKKLVTLRSEWHTRQEQMELQEAALSQLGGGAEDHPY